MTKLAQSPIPANTAIMITQYNSAARERLQARLTGNTDQANQAFTKMQMLQQQITLAKRR